MKKQYTVVTDNSLRPNNVRVVEIFMQVSQRYSYFFTCCFLSLFFVSQNSFSQSLTLGARSYLIMNGNVSLVVKDAAFINNGNFTEGTSTVKFSGYADTTASFLSGNNSTTFYNLTTQKPAYGTALKSMGRVRNVLNVAAGHLYCDSNLTLLSTSTLTARVDVVPSGSSIFGKAMVERYIPARRAWRLLTVPVTSSNTIFGTWQNSGVFEAGKGMYVTGPNPTGPGGNGLDASSMNNPSMKEFDYSTQSYSNVLNTHVPISSGTAGSADNVGYFAFVRGDRRFSNFNYAAGISNITTLTGIGRLQTGTQTFPASAVSGAFTLIGNSFASPIDFNSITRSNLIKRFYVWDPSLANVGAWVMLDDIDDDGIYTKSIGASNMTKNIQSGQAFMIQTNAAGAASISITESSKCGCNQNNVMGRPARPVNAMGYIRSHLYLVEPDSVILSDGVMTEFDAAYDAAVNLEDALKLTNINENLGLQRNGSGLSVERRPELSENDTIFFKLWKTNRRNYRLEFVPANLSGSGLQGFLEDSYLNRSVPVSLSSVTNVDFNINADAASAAANRFRIVFKTLHVLPVTITGIKATLQTDNDIDVEWRVENEINISRYEVERSIDGVSFTRITVVGPNADNNVSKSYHWLDENAVPGNNFYRIKIYETNGLFKYTGIVKVLKGETFAGIFVYPNPVTNNIIYLQFNGQPAGVYRIKLIDNSGKEIYKDKFETGGGNTTTALNIKPKLAAGIYKLEITATGKKKNDLKIMVE